MKTIKEKVIEECAKREHWGTEDMIDITLEEVEKVIDETFSEGFYNYFYTEYGKEDEDKNLEEEVNDKMLDDITRKVNELKHKLGINAPQGKKQDCLSLGNSVETRSDEEEDNIQRRKTKVADNHPTETNRPHTSKTNGVKAIREEGSETSHVDRVTKKE